MSGPRDDDLYGICPGCGGPVDGACRVCDPDPDEPPPSKVRRIGDEDHERLEDAEYGGQE